MDINKKRLQKLANIKELKAEPEYLTLDPFKLKEFIKLNIHDIRKAIINDGFDFDYYVDIKDWKFYPSDVLDKEYVPEDYTVITSTSDEDADLCIGFTTDIEYDLEGMGPIFSGSIIDVNGYRIQYQPIAS